MARNSPKRRAARGIWRRPYVTVSLTLTTLATKDLLSDTLSNAVDEKCRWMSIEAAYSLVNLTTGDGPIMFGVAHPDYSDPEIEEAIEAFGAVTLADKIANERANRLVRVIGVLTEQETAFRGGNLVKTRLNWMLATGQQPKVWAYNQGAALLSTGSEVTVQGWINLKY